MIFDGKESWKSRRESIDRAREIAAPRAALLSAAADARQAEADALAAAAAAAARADRSRAQASIQAARGAACAVQRALDSLAAAIADLPEEQAAFAAEIFGEGAEPMRSQDGGGCPPRKHDSIKCII